MLAFGTMGLSEENSQCLHLGEGSGLHELFTMYERRKPLDSSHSNDFHPKIHATILKKQNMYNCWGFYVLVRTVCDTLGVGILTIKEADHYWH